MFTKTTPPFAAPPIFAQELGKRNGGLDGLRIMRRAWHETLKALRDGTFVLCVTRGRNGRYVNKVGYAQELAERLAIEAGMFAN